MARQFGGKPCYVRREHGVGWCEGGGGGGVTDQGELTSLPSAAAGECRQRGLIDYAGAHLCGQAGSKHVSRLNFTEMDPDSISLPLREKKEKRRKSWFFIFRTAVSNGAWQVQEASQLSRPR